MFDLTWTVPEDAAAGIYDLSMILYGGAKNPDQDLSVPALDIETINFALIVDQDVSYIQLMEIPTFTGQKRVIYTHIAKGEVAKSGVLTFKVFASMVQLASIIGGGSLAGTSALHTFGMGLMSMFKWAQIENRVAKQREDGSADFLDIQVIGQGAVTYEDTSPLDIDVNTGCPSLPKIPICPTLIQEQYLKFECPHFIEIQFEWSTLAYLPEMEKYFPYWKFSAYEQWYPCSFYLDNNPDVTDNKDNYGKPEFNDQETGKPPYFVYIHAEEDARYLTIQYWLYYVFNEYKGSLSWMKPHMHDWDSTVYIIFDKKNLEEPKKVGFCYHIRGYTLDWSYSGLQKVDDHVIAYVAEGSHGAYHQLRGIWPEDYLFSWDEWNPGGITLGYENLTNWIIVRYCDIAKETTLPGQGDKIFCPVEHMTHNCIDPAPSEAVKENIVYWPRDFDPNCKAAWHQDKKWRSIEPPSFTLFVSARSPVNICVEDSLGRRTGCASGNISREIPESLYSGPETEPEIVAILNPSGDYIAHVYGISEGTFDLESWFYLNGSASLICNFTRVVIEKDQTRDYIIPEFPSLIISSLLTFISMLAIIFTKKRKISRLKNYSKTRKTLK